MTHTLLLTSPVQSNPIPFVSKVLLFDSVVMTGNTGTLHANGTITELPLDQLTPANETLKQEQMDWLEHRMSTSTADYLWLGGHFPVWAIGQDPPTGIRQILRDLLNKWEAQYFNGHEHDFEHIVEEGRSKKPPSQPRICSRTLLDCVAPVAPP